jgi:hypothetical protein
MRLIELAMRLDMGCPLWSWRLFDFEDAQPTTEQAIKVMNQETFMMKGPK